LTAVAVALRPHLRRNTGFIRFDPPWYGVRVLGPPLVKAGADVQAPDTVLLDLRSPPEAILAGMKDKWRYNIGLAARKGVTVRQFPLAGQGGPEPAGGPAGILGAELEQALGVFYTLLQETARRDGIAIHHIDYYRGLFIQAVRCQAARYRAAEAAPGPASPLPDVRLYLAEYQGRPLAGIVTLFRGQEGVYLYGASSGLQRNVMAPYALQWAAIRDAREAGCAVYDFFGVPPSGDPGHPMAGLYRFKTGFIGNSTGRIIHRSGSWDYLYRPVAAGLFKTAEVWRKRLRDLKKRRPKGPRASP
jgi:lipid II:glycine glycyltransferase (peptidoglycan interpeptide bridge formation enzyme)